MSKFKQLITSAVIIGAATCWTAEAEPLNSDFYSGQIRLSKSFFDSSAFGRDELRDAYKNGEWIKLVNLVLSKRAAWDTYYFYLGRAAEELGHKKAAITYYDLAINSDRYKKCNVSSMINLCDGFTFPRDAQSRRDALASKGREKTYPIGTGPTLQELITLTPKGIDEISKMPDQFNFAKSKFETDEEFSKRAENTPQSYFLAANLDTNRKNECESTYNHATSTYEIIACQAFSSKIPTLTKTTSGDPFTLANAFDKRVIAREIHNTYYLLHNQTWNATYKITREEAKKIDSDLAIGIVFSKKLTSSECPICKSREALDATNDLVQALADFKGKPLTSNNNGWRDDAFKTGVLVEYWNHFIKPDGANKFVVFRKSDLRVIYELQIAND